MTALTDNQVLMQRVMGRVSDIVVAWAAPKVPAIGQMTAQGQVDELGDVKAAMAQLKKIEEVMKDRLKILAEGKKQVVGDRYKSDLSMAPRVALDQTAAKAYFEAAGLLGEYVKETMVETLRVTKV